MVRGMVRLRTQASAPALSSVAELCAFVSGQLRSHADPAKAGPMAAYMKTDMPFYGVAKPERDRIATAIKDRFPIADHHAYDLSRSACAHEAVPGPCGRPRHCRVTAAGESAGKFSA